MCYCLWLGSGICPPRTIPLGPKCIVLVIVFEGEIDKGNQYEEKVTKNNKDFVEFCKAVGVQDGKIKIDGIECWIKKVSVNISKSYTFLVE